MTTRRLSFPAARSFRDRTIDRAKDDAIGHVARRPRPYRLTARAFQ
jgi:hypothetical protein